MFKLDSEEALFTAFRPKDRKSVEPPPKVSFPLFVQDYLAWTHPAGGRVFLIYSIPGGVPTGIAFDTNGGAAAGVPQMCDWCHSSGMDSQVALLTARLNGQKRLGVHLCSDLGCKRKLEEDANRSGRSVLPAMKQLLERMARFGHEGLGIDPSGAGR